MDAINPPLPHNLLTSLMRTRPLVALASPVIYLLIIPFAIADLSVSLYQAICFPAYGITQVRRAHYFNLDRAKLSHLDAIEKLNCVYCAYVQGVLAYTRDVAAQQCRRPVIHSEERLDVQERDYQMRAALKALAPPLKPLPAPRSVTRAVRPLR